MTALSDLGVRQTGAWRAAWSCGDAGFAVVCPVSGSVVVAAVGTVEVTGPLVTEEARRRMTGVVQDVVLFEGHDAGAVLEQANAALAAQRIGHLDSVALLSRTHEHLPASVIGRGLPPPLVVAPDRLVASVRGGLSLDRGWAVVLGAADVDGAHPAVLSPPEVRDALALLDDGTAEPRVADRTLLAVVAR